MFDNKYDVFLAYHGSYEKGTKGIAFELYSFLMARGLKVFFFPAAHRDAYKANIIESLNSRTFILVCNEELHLDGGSIDKTKHYELSTEIDAFYSLTQLGNEASVADSKILMCGDTMVERKKGDEQKYHVLFANRVHVYMEENKQDQAFEEIAEWVENRIAQSSVVVDWNSSRISMEIKKVFARRSAVASNWGIENHVSEAKDIRCVGISNTELTTKLDTEALQFAIDKGAKVEMFFLHPNSKFTADREEEEGHAKDYIKNMTEMTIAYISRFKKRLKAEQKDSVKIYTYDILPRMNMLLMDSQIILQYYANRIPGMKNPSFLIERQESSPVYDFCIDIFDYIKTVSKEIVEDEV